MLSRETLISMLKNEYPSSYNAHDVDNMSVKELDDLLDYLDSMQNKASGGLMLDNTKTYHQANDYTAPPDLEIMLGYKKGGITSQLVRKNQDGSRPGYAGPAGGASAGGNYGGNRNPDQTYGGSIFSGGSGSGTTKTTTTSGGGHTPPPLKKKIIVPPMNTDNFFMKYIKKFNPFDDEATEVESINTGPALELEEIRPADNVLLGSGLAEETKQTLLGNRKKAEDINERFAFLKADGGRINFSNGGSGNWYDNLEGQGKNIYDSMKAFGHDDNVIKETLISGGYYTPDGTPVETEQVTGIINQDIGGGGGGGGISNLDLTYNEKAVPRGPVTDFNINPAAQLTGKGRLDPVGSDVDYFNALSGPERFNYGFQMSDVPGQPGYETPSQYFQEPSLIDKGIGSIKDFFSNLGTPKVRGTLGTRLSNQPRIPLPGALAAYSLSPFNEASKNYNPDLVDQLNFLELQDGMIGRDQASGLLKYGDDSVLRGKNVISLAGTNDYEEALMDYITKMKSYKNQTDYQQNQIRKAELELAALAASQNKGGDSGTTFITKTGSGDGGNYQGGAKAGTTGSWTPGGTYTARGRHHSMADGGLATMFTRRR
tara:strand:+ start:91 stop:1887 length:1797 start_codon:yes stop_codon:yes gene_type:complete